MTERDIELSIRPVDLQRLAEQVGGAAKLALAQQRLTPVAIGSQHHLGDVGGFGGQEVECQPILLNSLARFPQSSIAFGQAQPNAPMLGKPIDSFQQAGVRFGGTSLLESDCAGVEKGLNEGGFVSRRTELSSSMARFQWANSSSQCCAVARFAAKIALFRCRVLVGRARQCLKREERKTVVDGNGSSDRIARLAVASARSTVVTAGGIARQAHGSAVGPMNAVECSHDSSLLSGQDATGLRRRSPRDQTASPRRGRFPAVGMSPAFSLSLSAEESCQGRHPLKAWHQGGKALSPTSFLVCLMAVIGTGTPVGHQCARAMVTGVAKRTFKAHRDDQEQQENDERGGKKLCRRRRIVEGSLTRSGAPNR